MQLDVISNTTNTGLHIYNGVMNLNIGTKLIPLWALDPGVPRCFFLYPSLDSHARCIKLLLLYAARPMAKWVRVSRSLYYYAHTYMCSNVPS